jgi:STE24 endopeptidase
LRNFQVGLNASYWSDKLPAELSGIYSEEKYKKSQNYEKAKQKFSLFSSVFSLAILLLMLYFNGFAMVDQWVRGISEQPVLMALLFFGVLAFIMDIITIPFDIYETFVIEENFGFNKTSPKLFIVDKLKSWLLAIIIGGGLLSLVVWIYTVFGSSFWLVVWGVLAALMVFITMFYSSLIVPLFNKQTPLEDGKLRTAIEDFAQKVGFNLQNIFVIDGSKRSSKANAYFSGLGHKKRIVLYDTLIKDHSVEELVAVLAHEVGHYKKKHTLAGLFVSLLQTGLMLFILSFFIGNPVLSNALGANNSSFHLGILAFGILYTPISLVLGLLTNIVSRKNEFAADQFAVDYYDGDSLAIALKKLSVNNLSNLRPHPAYVFFYYSHPPLLKRLGNISK